jgi:hypothetical protein
MCNFSISSGIVMYVFFENKDSSSYTVLNTKLFNQGFLKNRLILSFKKFLGIYQLYIEKFSVSCVKITKDDIDN